MLSSLKERVLSGMGRPSVAVAGYDDENEDDGGESSNSGSGTVQETQRWNSCPCDCQVHASVKNSWDRAVDKLSSEQVCPCEERRTSLRAQPHLRQHRSLPNKLALQKGAGHSRAHGCQVHHDVTELLETVMSPLRHRSQARRSSGKKSCQRLGARQLRAGSRRSRS
jgi:hypothetical protein